VKNYFIELIEKKTITTRDELQKAFHQAAKKTHPDSSGLVSDIPLFITLKEQYDEACLHFQHDSTLSKTETAKKNLRYTFFRELHILMTLKSMKVTAPVEEEIHQSELKTERAFTLWLHQATDLYQKAMSELYIIEDEGNLNTLETVYKPAVIKTIEPLLFTICAFHLSGIDFHKKQMERNWKEVKNLLHEKNMKHLEEFFLLLVSDARWGAALFTEEF
jgi:hypothetical protein